jgi:hypothetical protein
MEAAYHEEEEQKTSRLRARIPKHYAEDDDEEDFFTNRRRKPVRKLAGEIEHHREPKEPKAPRAPRQPKEKPERHHPEPHDPLVKEREITTDESSLFWILRYSKSSITVCGCVLGSLVCKLD